MSFFFLLDNKAVMFSAIESDIEWRIVSWHGDLCLCEITL
jgi:hypothetical protein